MKTLISFVLSSIFVLSFIHGQNSNDQNIQNLRSNNLKVETDYLDVKIVTWNNDYIGIKSDVKINMGMDNDAHILTSENASGGIMIQSTIDADKIQKMVITTDKEGNNIGNSANYRKKCH